MADVFKFMRMAAMCTGLLAASHAPLLQAQDSNNILGLAPVPQSPAPSASAAKKSTTPAKPTETDIKSVLAGSIKLVSFYDGDLLTVRATTAKAFTDAKSREQALQAAKLFQRDARPACGNLCKVTSTPPPKLLEDNTLSFDVVVKGYAGQMSVADMINLVSGKRISAAAPAAPASAASKP